MTQVLIDRATLEQLVGALEAVLDDHEDLASCEARHELRTALAQHREQQPVCHGCGIPAGDVHMSTCKSGKWPSRVSNGDTAALAQQDDSLQAKYLKSELAHILAQQELPQKERPDFMAGYDAGMADAKRMAQQGEQPTQRQLDTAMRQWETWKAYALELQAKVVKYEGGSPMLLNAAAPAQQWEPVAWYEYNQDLDAWFLAYGHNPKAKTRPLVFGDTAAPAPQAQQGEPVCAGCGIPAGDVHMSTCKSGKWPSRVSNGDTAAPAPQAQDALQDIAAYIGVGGYNGATTEQLSERIRVEFDRLAALQSAQPVAQPRDLTDEHIAAANMCRKAGRVSVSMVQRKMNIGYQESQVLVAEIVAAGLVDGIEASGLPNI